MSLSNHPRWTWPLRFLVFGLAAWEASAIAVDKPEYMPTLSTLAGRHPWLKPTLVAALYVHLWWPFEEKN